MLAIKYLLVLLLIDSTVALFGMNAAACKTTKAWKVCGCSAVQNVQKDGVATASGAQGAKDALKLFSLENTYCTQPDATPCVYADSTSAVNSCKTAATCYSYCQPTSTDRPGCIITAAVSTFWTAYSIGGNSGKWSRLCSPLSTTKDYEYLGQMMSYFGQAYRAASGKINTTTNDGNLNGGVFYVPLASEDEFYCYGRVDGYIIHSKINNKFQPKSEYYLPGETKKVTGIVCNNTVDSAPVINFAIFIALLFCLY